MVIEKELDALDGKRQLVVREHCLLEEETVPKIAIDETGGYQVSIRRTKIKLIIFNCILMLILHARSW